MMMLKEMLCGEKGGCSDGVVIFLEILEELEQTLRASTMRRLPHRAVEPGASESSSGQWKQGTSIGIMCGVWVVMVAGCACFGSWGRGRRGIAGPVEMNGKDEYHSPGRGWRSSTVARWQRCEACLVVSVDRPGRCGGCRGGNGCQVTIGEKRER